MKGRILKGLALTGMLALCLSLTGCYIPPDDLSGDTQNLTVGSNNLPYQTVAVTQRPTETPTAEPTASTGSQPTINWDQFDGVNTPAVTGEGTGEATDTPRPGVIAVVTKAPTATPDPNEPTATPTPLSLQNGMSGDQVRSLQRRLKDLGYLSGSADGDFGPATEQAVRWFQEVNGLTVDGKAGRNTMAKINSSSAKKAPEPTKAPTATPRPTATPNIANARYLTVGSTGKDVRQLQQRLIALGWLEGEADGEYGEATAAAVKAFQAATRNLWDDGIAGPDTQNAIYASNAAKATNAVAATGARLEMGSEGDAVKTLQKRLKELDYLSGSADGKFGEATKAAVIAFQSNNGLKVDGIAGSGTLNKLYSSSAKKAGSTGSSTNNNNQGEITSTGYVTLREGDKSDAVEKLQRTLKNLGYYTGSVDGSYGAGTKAAVEQYQKMNKLTADGVAGPQTQRALYGTNSTSSYATLRPGDEGSGVTNLQYTLYELGYYDGKVNGIYNDLTKNAVKDFQIRNDLEADGVAGNKTLQRLYSSKAVAAGAKEKEFETLRKGDSNDMVVQMQSHLVKLGYLGSITGEYDDATFWAVKSFQEKNKLSADGAAGNQTLQLLFYGNPVSAN